MILLPRLPRPRIVRPDSSPCRLLDAGQVGRAGAWSAEQSSWNVGFLGVLARENVREGVIRCRAMPAIGARVCIQVPRCR
jgi:hypothetical protein